jgi:hypothetical protein
LGLRLPVGTLLGDKNILRPSAKIADNLLVDSGCITYVRDETTKQKKEIGHGAFGNVYAADYLGSEVAVNEVKLDVVNSESLAQFVAPEQNTLTLWTCTHSG